MIAHNLLFLGQWSEEYARIIHRFRNIIAAQFFGHTHQDEFEIFFGDNDVEERIPNSNAIGTIFSESVIFTYYLYLIQTDEFLDSQKCLICPFATNVSTTYNHWVQ